MQGKNADIGIDLGGTNLRAALVDRRGNVLEMCAARVPLDKGAQAVSSELAVQCRVLIDAAAALGVAVCSVGLGIAGKIDRAGGSVIFSPNLPELNGCPIGQDLRRELSISVFMENDANVFGLGESWKGAVKGVRNWVGITLGTGTGGCLFLDGKLWEGDGLGFSAEIGHTIVEPGGPVCPCGSKGCLEAFASARALIAGARRAVSREKKDSPLRTLERSGELNAEAVYRCAAMGDPTAVALFEKMGWALGIALANVFSLLGIRRAVIGGGVSAAWDLFRAQLGKTLAENASMLGPGKALVTPGSLGGNAALIGAARLWRAGGSAVA
jgi:glucokinase